jgi:hypothetical protein
MPIICANEGEKIDGRIKGKVNSNFGYDHDIMVITEYKLGYAYRVPHLFNYFENHMTSRNAFNIKLVFYFSLLCSKHYSHSEILVGLHTKWLLKVSDQNEN